MENNTDDVYKAKRFFEIDFVKGFATIFMIIFHFFYLMYFMDIVKFEIKHGILHLMAKISHTIFILMVGVNSAISYNKFRNYPWGSGFITDIKKQIKKSLVRVAKNYMRLIERVCDGTICGCGCEHCVKGGAYRKSGPISKISLEVFPVVETIIALSSRLPKIISNATSS